jgi:hypothetical protein
MIIFHWNLIKKKKRKIQWDFDPKVYFENDLSDVVHICLENWFFLSINPRHSSKAYNPKHTSKHAYSSYIPKVMCVHVSVLVSVYIIRVHCPLHHTLDTFYGLFAKKIKSMKVKYYKTPKCLHSNFGTN